MLSFLTKFAGAVRGALCGFDPLFLRGSLRNTSYRRGLPCDLGFNRIPYKDFAQHWENGTARLEDASLRQTRERGREICYPNNSRVSKERIARQIAAREPIREGLIGVPRGVDPCLSFQMRKNGATKQLEIQYRKRKGLHLDHYQMHPAFGFLHARIQTWSPFTV
jgi:hypothetical protein